MWRGGEQMKLTRRGLGAGGLTLASADRIVPIRAVRAEGGTVTIAYNVGLPAWDPTVGPSAVNPTIQALLPVGVRSIHRPQSGPVVHRWPARKMGLERRRHRHLDGRAQGGDVARRLAGHA